MHLRQNVRKEDLLIDMRIRRCYIIKNKKIKEWTTHTLKGVVSLTWMF